MSPVALIDHLKVVQNKTEVGVIQGLLTRSRAMQIIPWANAPALNIRVTIWGTLPTNTFRKINDAYTESAGSRTQSEETVYPIGGYTDTDVIFIRNPAAFVSEKADQLEMRIASLSYTFNDYFINGSQATDPDGFTGIKNRIAGLPSTQSIVAATNGLDVKASTANQNSFVDLLDQLIQSIDNGGDVGGRLAFWMNDTTILGISSTLRRLGLLDQTRDMFGRYIDAYKGIPFYDIGVKADQTTKIITNTETTGASSLTTSIYLTKMMEGDQNADSGGQWLHGLQLYPMDVIDHGRLQTKPAERMEIDWPIGLAHFHKRTMARLSGIIWS